MTPRILLPLLILATTCGCSAPSAPESSEASTFKSRPWDREIIYFMMTDRFLDGDTSNNHPVGTPPALYDPEQLEIDLYHGGDFRGLEMALRDGYFNDLGITAIWITPPVRNVRLSQYDLNDQPKTGYHGYWTQDFLDIDPQLVSRTSLDGSKTYPDNRDGRMEHYRDLVELAHRKGIRIIQDIVCNHAGPVFFYDGNGNGIPDPHTKSEWIRPYLAPPASHHPDAHWADNPSLNQRRTEPAGPLTILGQSVPTSGILSRLEAYTRRGMSPESLGARDGEEILCDFFSLRDLNTAPDAEHFDELVREFVEIYAFYIETIGVDGFRIDTVKHVHHEFWDAFTRGLRERLGPERAKSLFMVGEIYDGNPAALGKYTYRSDWSASDSTTETGLDSVLDFQLMYAIRDYLRPAGQPFGSAKAIERAMDSRLPTAPAHYSLQRPFYNQAAGPDGLSPARKLVNFAENHDGLNRFRVAEISADQNRLANALLMSLPGIPCLYYGTEADLHDLQGTVGQDGETGRATYIRPDDLAMLQRARSTETFQTIAALAQIRRNYPALSSGQMQPLWVDNDATDEDDGVFAFACTMRGETTVIVVINADDSKNTAGSREHPLKLVDRQGQPLLQPNEVLQPIYPAASNSKAVPPDWNGGTPETRLIAPATQISLWEITE